jgi:hypothetical protein
MTLKELATKGNRRLEITLNFILGCFTDGMTAEQCAALSKVELSDVKSEFERLRKAGVK